MEPLLYPHHQKVVDKRHYEKQLSSKCYFKGSHYLKQLLKEELL
jgi:hypothetical protein